MAILTYKKNGIFMRDVDGFKAEFIVKFAEIAQGYSITFQCHNVTIMKNAQGYRVIIQEVK